MKDILKFYNEMYYNSQDKENVFVGCIYRHYIVIDGVETSYIGQTTNKIDKRWGKHGKGYTQKETKFENAIYEYGWRNFEHTIIEFVVKETKEELKINLNRLESYYIDKYDSYVHGFNSTKGNSYEENDNKKIEELKETTVESTVLEDEEQKPNKRLPRKVKCLNTGVVFNNTKEAAKWCGLKYDGQISRVCNGRNGSNTAGRNPQTRERLEWCWVY